MSLAAKDYIELFTGIYGKAPELDELQMWRDQGLTTRPQVAEAMLNVGGLSGGLSNYGEDARFGGMSNEDFLIGLYDNFFDRLPDNSGFNWWVNQLETGGFTRAQAVMAFTDAAKTGATTQHQLDYLNTQNDYAEFVAANNGYNGDTVTLKEGNWDAHTRWGNNTVQEFWADNTTGANNPGIGWPANSQGSSHLFINDIRLNGNQVITKDIAFGMRSTDVNANFTALFDSNSLINAAPSASGSQFVVNLMDLGTETNPYSADQPLGQLNVEGFKFKLAGVEYELKSDGIYNAKTYAELFAAVQTALALEQAANPALVGVSASLVPGGFTTTAYSSTGLNQLVTGDSIKLVDANGRTFESNGFIQRQDGTSDFTLFGRQSVEAPEITSALIEVNVALDDVGRGSVGGDLMIGGMSGSRGVQQFNLEVDRNSWLNEVKTTTNNNGLTDLEKVVVTSTGKNGTLQINKVTDIKTLDATAFKGSFFSVTGEITENVIARDLNLKDTANNPAADNVTYKYDLSSQRDHIDLTVNGKALSHEDFLLEINAGAGNDTVILRTDFAAGTHQLANQQALNNIKITATSGDNTIWTAGAGDARIEAGAGNDTVYTDNSGGQPITLDAANPLELAAAQLLGLEFTTTTGGSALADAGTYKAHWVLNAANEELTDLEGQELNEYFLWNTKLQVTFSAGNVGLTEGAAVRNTNGFESLLVDIPTGPGFVADERHINQAIKKAINDDPVLSKLLEATDGPNNTLIVRSLIDGDYAADDLRIDIIAPSVQPTGSDLTNVNSAWKSFNDDSSIGDLTGATALDTIDDQLDSVQGNYDDLTTVKSDGTTVTVAEPAQAEIGGNAVTGGNSGFESNNTINLGRGDDVLVLGTGADSNDTIVFTGYNNGHNTIVNFDQNSAGTGVDYLNFTSYLTTHETNSGSTTGPSVVRMDTEFEDAGALLGNTVSIIDFVNGSGANVNQTWANLSAKNLVDLLNDTEAYGDAANTGAFNVYDADNGNTAMSAAGIVGNTNNHIFLVHNTHNEGQYKVFHVTSTKVADGDAGDFNTNAQLVGVIDLGAELDTAVAVDMDAIFV